MDPTKTLLVCRAEDLGTVVVTGADRVTWLNGLVTCDLATAQQGSAVYGLAVTKKGRILADLVIVLRAGDVVVAAPEGTLGQVRAAFDHHLVMEDAEISDDGPAVWRAIGARAAELALEPPATVTPFDWAGVGGAIVLGDAAIEDTLRARVEGLGGALVAADAWEALRIAQGVPRFGVDFDDATYPQEASLEKRAVSFQKGCYLGQEVVCMLELRGQVQRKLVGVALDADAPRGAELRDAAGAAVGRLTSVTRTDAGWAGLAMVRLASAQPGTELSAGTARARVLEPRA